MRKLLTALLVALGLSLAASSAHASVVSLWGGDTLFPGQSLRSPHCFYHLVFQGDGNLVLYGSGNQAIWWTGTQNQNAAFAQMQRDGNLVIYTWGGGILWDSHTWGNPGARLDLQDDGNLVIYRSNRTAAWWSGTQSGESLGSSTCPATASTGTAEDTNLQGGDYRVFDLSQPRGLFCAYYCSQDPACVAYTYVPPGVQGPAPRCWLKNRVPLGSYGRDFVSGVISR